MKRLARPLAALLALAVLGGANDPSNPTCPAEPDWGPAKAMTLTPQVINGDHVLIAEALLRRRYGEAERRLVAHLEALRAAQVAQARRLASSSPQGGRA